MQIHSDVYYTVKLYIENMIHSVTVIVYTHTLDVCTCILHFTVIIIPNIAFDFVHGGYTTQGILNALPSDLLDVMVQYYKCNTI